METTNWLYARTYYYGVRVMTFKPSSFHKFFFTYICPRFYGGGAPSTPSQTTQTVNQNSIPAELLPYVKNMLNKAEPLTQEAYKPYSTNAGDYVAPFSPLQQQAQTSAAGLQTPGQFAPASQMAGISGLGSMMAGQNYQNQATNPNSISAYMSPYMQNVMQQQGRELNRNYDITGVQQQGQATQAGAFGGSREALMASENDRNRNMALNKMQAEGLQNAYQQANQNQQFGSTLGLQGMGQGIQGAQALGNLGTSQLGAETSVLNTQNTVGGQQQAQQQQAINQSVLNYQNAQQYPYMQLGFMSDLLRGTPTGNTTQTQYQAQPGMASQIGGLAATGLGAYAALKAKGGPIEDKGYKSGGIVGYKIGGDVEESMRSKLEDLDKPHLAGIIQKNESPIQTGLAREVYATKLARGGIVAFANKEKAVEDKEKKNPLLKRHEKMSELQSEVAPVVNKTDMGIAADITPVQAATLGPMSDEESLKNMALNQAEGYKPPVQTSGIAAVGGPSVADKVLFEQKQAALREQLPTDMKGILTAQQENIAAAQAEADKSVESRVKESSDLKEKLLGKDTDTKDYREQLTQERANAPDEARRQMGMRLMEFGANWASTPGAPLVAGMKALKETLPSVMEDTKDNKKLMKDLDKSIYLLNHSERLDAEGRIDAAAKAREDASKIVMDQKEKLVTFGIKRMELEQTAQIAREKMANDLQQQKIAAGAIKYAADARASGSGSGNIPALAAKIAATGKELESMAAPTSRLSMLKTKINSKTLAPSPAEKAEYDTLLKEFNAGKKYYKFLISSTEYGGASEEDDGSGASTGGGESGLPSLNDINAELAKRLK